MGIKEIILQRLEALLILGGFNEEQLSSVALEYALEYCKECCSLLLEWTDVETVKRDLFGGDQ